MKITIRHQIKLRYYDLFLLDAPPSPFLELDFRFFNYGFDRNEKSHIKELCGAIFGSFELTL